MSFTAVATAKVKINGTELREEVLNQLITAVVEQSLTVPDMFTLEFRDPYRTILEDLGVKVGSTVDISVSTFAKPGGEKLIEGAEVTALEAEFSPDGSMTIVRGMDKSFRAYGNRMVAAYKNSTLSDAAKKVAQRAGLSIGKVDSTTKVYENLTQNNLSDWAFIKSMAREVGFDAWVSKGKLNFCKPTASSGAPSPGQASSTDELQLTPDEDLISFRCALTAGQQVKDVKVRGWDAATKKAVVGSAPAGTVSATAGQTPAALATLLGNPSFVSVEAPRSTQDEADLAAKTIAETIGGSSTIFEGLAVGSTKLKAGVPISLGMTGKPFDGKYTLSETRHIIDPEGYTTWFAVNGRNDRSLLGLSAGPPIDPLGGRRIHGVVVGLVTAANDPEKLCRVKLKFPWLSDDYETDWARNAQVWAGKGYGSVIVPEVNDEVLVAFEQGDIHKPFVIGGLYNGVDKPYAGVPAELVGSDGKVNRRDLVSRTGHVLSMTELPGQNDGILIQTAGKGYKLDLNKQQKIVTLEADGTVVIEAKGTGAMTIKAAGNLDISGRQITIKAQSGISIDGGGGPVDIKAGPKVGVQAAVVDINGTGKADLKAGGIVTVQGALVKIN